MTLTVKNWIDGPGLVLLDSNGHFWLIEVSTSGVVTTSDLGTSDPSSTPLEATAMEDLETRLAAYTDLLAPGALLWSDSFATDQIAAEYDSAPSAPVVSGGVLLAGTINTDHEVAKKTLKPGSCLQQLKMTVGSTASTASTKIGLLADYSDANRLLIAQYEANGRNLSVYAKTAAATYVNIFSATGVEAALSNGNTRWLRLLTTPGGGGAAAIYNTDPEANGDSGIVAIGSITASGTTTGAAAKTRARLHTGMSSPGRVGLSVNFPSTGNWSADDYKIWKA